MTFEEALETTKIHSITGTLPPKTAYKKGTEVHLMLGAFIFYKGIKYIECK